MNPRTSTEAVFSYDPVLDALRVCFPSGDATGSEATEIDEGLWATFDARHTATEVYAEGATFARPPAWRPQLERLVGASVLARLDKAASEAAHVDDELVLVPPDELQRLRRNWVEEHQGLQADLAGLAARLGTPRTQQRAALRLPAAGRDVLERVASMIGSGLDALTSAVARPTLNLGYRGPAAEPVDGASPRSASPMDVPLDPEVARAVGLSPTGAAELRAGSFTISFDRTADRQGEVRLTVEVLQASTGLLLAGPALFDRGDAYVAEAVLDVGTDVTPKEIALRFWFAKPQTVP
jgi:hypothetical protein